MKLKIFNTGTNTYLYDENNEIIYSIISIFKFSKNNYEHLYIDKYVTIEINEKEFDAITSEDPIIRSIIFTILENKYL
jgi:hypothetical protein